MINNKRIGLALSGGGYRAAAYHLGTMRALHKLGILEKVDVISSVSGGSITAAYYMQNKNGAYEKFESNMICKLKHNVLWVALLYLVFILCISLCLCIIVSYGWCVVGIIWVFTFYKILPISIFIQYAYNILFFKNIHLDELPKYPILAINSTDLSTGNLFTFSQERMSCYPYKGKLEFMPKGFPLAKAVMASSCIPQFFSPVKISKKYASGNSDITPLLVDGGIYDNQGAHKFGSSDSHYKVDCAIVSDAGNTIISSKKCINPILTLLLTANILMQRIKNCQRQHNSYIRANKKKVLFAYNDLMWTSFEQFPKRFVKNIHDGYIPAEVLNAHGISQDMVRRLQNEDTTQEAFFEVLQIVEGNIGWNQLLKRKPKYHDIAQKVGTNLIGLKEKQIKALMEHSEWMTEVQVKLHLPFLLNSL